VAEIVADEEERFVLVPGEGIGEAVAEVEPRGVASPSTKPAMRYSCDLRLSFGHRFDGDSILRKEVVEILRTYGILSIIEHY